MTLHVVLSGFCFFDAVEEARSKVVWVGVKRRLIVVVRGVKITMDGITWAHLADGSKCRGEHDVSIRYVSAEHNNGCCSD